MNVVWESAKELAESKGWVLHRLTGGYTDDYCVNTVSVCSKMAPWKHDPDGTNDQWEDSGYGTEFFTHRFIYTDEYGGIFESGHYMIREFGTALEDARERG